MVNLRLVGIWIGCSVPLFMASDPARGVVTDSFVPGDYVKPTECPAYFTFNKSTTACEADAAEIAKLTEDADCKAAGFRMGAQGKCIPGDKPPNPQCKLIAGYSSKISGTGATAECAYQRTSAVSASGDFVGDCFKIKVVPPGTTLVADQYYAVTGQRIVDNEDRELTLVPGYVGIGPTFGCHAQTGAQHRVSASKLLEAGASRQGYTYGLLTMPYKYFPGEKSFLVNVPIGGYFGWRYGQAGSGTTLALAMTLSSVKANTVDPNQLDAHGKPTVTGTAEVAALSGAAGIVFDITKSPRGRPFKAGVFVGRDVVSKDPTIEYRFNRKTWLALQIGFDFTDN